MANAHSAEAQTHNPAALNKVQHWAVAYNYLYQLNLTSFHSGAFAIAHSSAYVWAVAIQENGDEVYREGEMALCGS